MDGAWILLGMMGVGKSAVGRELASLTGRQFVDTDFLIEHKLGRKIESIFARYGEEAFRGHENAVLKSLQRESIILSTGGGAILRQDNWDEFRRLGTTIYLQASPEVLIDHLTTSKKRRPLLQVENWEDRVISILASRVETYAKADIKIDVQREDSVENIAAKVLAAITELKNENNP